MAESDGPGTLGHRVLFRDAHGSLEALSGVYLQSLEVHEAIGYLTRGRAELACLPDVAVDERLVPGNDIAFALEFGGVTVRWFHFLIREVNVSRVRGAAGAPSDVRHFSLEVATRMEKLALVSSHGVFVDQSLLEIFEAKLGLFGFEPAKADGTGDYEIQLEPEGRGDGHRRRAITIQYGESDMNFMARLAEHAGISVFIEHDAKSDRTVATDMPQRFRPCAGAETAFLVSGGEKRGVFEFAESRALAPNAYVVRDYNHREPLHELRGMAQLAGDDFVGGVYEYGGAVSAEHAAYLAKVRAEERACRQQVFSGKSVVPQFLAGGRTSLLDEEGGLPVADLLLVEVRHRATFPTPWNRDVDASYDNAFRACSGSRMYRPPPLAERPKLPPFVTGTIAPSLAGNPSAEGGEVDAAGCYRVRFHFDADTALGEHPSCLMRMAQPYAGGTEGFHFPLRLGTEVLVGFVGGDPDRPVIVGALPNAITPSVVTASNASTQRFVSPFGSLFEFGKARG